MSNHTSTSIRVGTVMTDRFSNRYAVTSITAMGGMDMVTLTPGKNVGAPVDVRAMGSLLEHYSIA